MSHQDPNDQRPNPHGQPPYDQGGGADPYDFGNEEVYEAPPPDDEPAGAAPAVDRFAVPNPDAAYDMEATHNRNDLAAAQAQYAGTDELYGGAYNDPDADLASMYVKKEKGEVGTEGLTIREGLPPEPPKSYVWVFVLIFLLFGAVAIAGVMLFVRLDLVDQTGERRSVPLYSWVMARATMDEQQAALQALDEDELAFVISRSRIRTLYDEAFKFFVRNGRGPRGVEELVSEGLVPETLLTDGWHQDFLIEQLQVDVEVRSMGRDGLVRTSDDMVITNSGLRIPPAFEELEFEQSFQF